MKTVVVIDAGGRGAALVDAYAKSSEVGKIIAIPGNDLMQLNSSKPVVTYKSLKTTDVKEIVDVCHAESRGARSGSAGRDRAPQDKKESTILVDVAQDNAVAAGVADALLAEGFSVCGPAKSAGELEWNKAFAREFMARHKIPQPEFFTFDNYEKGIAFLTTQPNQPWFVKAAGLCEGKGALPAANNAEAEERIIELKKFKEAGKTFLLEKWLKSEGRIAEEFSAFAVSDGNVFSILGYAQDHKRALDQDKGENTGGMGCSTPPLVVDNNIKHQTEEIFKKTFDGMKKEGRPYKGILYLGGIIIKSKIKNQKSKRAQVLLGGDRLKRSVSHGSSQVDGENKVYVIEFNARWGDPEAEVIVPGIKTDFYQLGMAIFNGNLSSIKLETDCKARVSVALCAKGYPQDYKLVKGKEILGIDEAVKMPGVTIYGAGITSSPPGRWPDGLPPGGHGIGNDPQYFVNGGRVLHVIGEGKDILEARGKAYSAIEKLSIDGNNLHHRTDIGWRDLKRISK